MAPRAAHDDVIHAAGGVVWRDVGRGPEIAVIQLNDTHPVIAIVPLKPTSSLAS